MTILTLCVPNVAATSTSKLATETHNKCTTDQPVNVAQPTFMLIMLKNKFGDPISATQPRQPYCVAGLLGWGDPNVFDQGRLIGGAKVHIYGSFDGNMWLGPFCTISTLTGENNGLFAVNFPHGQDTPTGVMYFKATYDGDVQYNPYVSNVVHIEVIK